MESGARSEVRTIWLRREWVDALHFQQLKRFGGLYGVRDAGAIDSAPGRGTVVTVCWPGEHDPAPEFPGLTADPEVHDDGEAPR